MAQNLKIILDNVKDTTPKNVLFNDTIHIKADSKIALTSFNASFDLNKVGQTFLDESFIFNLNKTLHDSPREIKIPNKTYYNFFVLMIDVMHLINKSFSSYEPTLSDKRAFTGFELGLTAAQGAANKLAVGLDNIPLTTFTYQLNFDNELHEYDEDNYIVYHPNNLEQTDLYIKFPNTTSSSETPDNVIQSDANEYLIQSGGVAFEYNMLFRKNNSIRATNNYVKVFNTKGDSMSLYYRTTPRAGINTPAVSLEVVKRVSGVETTHYIGNEFFNYDEEINVNANTSFVDGPWSQKDASKSSYFLWCQRDGKWIIVFYDATTELFTDVYTDGIEFNMEYNYSFEKYIQNLLQVKLNGNAKGTLKNTTKLTGATTINTTFDFSNATKLAEILGFVENFKLLPEDKYSSGYVASYPYNFYRIRDFELALEIDTIKIKNFVASTDSSKSGRKNVISYFTPSTEIGSSDVIYSFVPSTPIFLAVDNKQDIQMNSMNVRFFQTYNNNAFEAETLTFVLTNM
jgi:hypothetical protein